MKTELGRSRYNIPHFEQVTHAYAEDENNKGFIFTLCFVKPDDIMEWRDRDAEKVKDPIRGLPRYVAVSRGPDDELLMYPAPDKIYDIKLRYIETKEWS